MKCRIKRIDNDSYFNKNIGFQNHWTYINEAKVFGSVADARATIKVYKIKKAGIEKVIKK
jgi:hypothetical protein